MKIYKNPFVSRELYFVKTGAARTHKMEASASKGYCVEFLNGQWKVTEAVFYNSSLRDDMPVIAENNTSIKSVIERAILDAVLDLVGEAKRERSNENAE